MFLRLSHTRLDVFAVSKELTLCCYKITAVFPTHERFALSQQIRRAVVSIHLNIAEGASRQSVNERKRYFEIARGSVVEVDAAIDIATELGYTRDEDTREIGNRINRCFQMLSKLIDK
ncbi:MAG: four helix bundle protein [Chitinophagaceae bacterium]|nr:four helix bundle protein [Chitinophagaceae bacterium]